MVGNVFTPITDGDTSMDAFGEEIDAELD